MVEKFSQNSCLENFDSIFLSESEHECVVLMLLPNLIGILTCIFFFMLLLPRADVDFLKAFD